MPSHYEVLDVAPDSSPQTIKTAYRVKILQAHPDKSKTEDIDGAVAAIQSAYRVLSDPKLRVEYDQSLLDNAKKLGLLLSGAGLDVYGLEEFEVDDESTWLKDCPRCETESAMCLTIDDLENGTEDGEGYLEVALQCQSCSLWIKVKYSEQEEDEI